MNMNLKGIMQTMGVQPGQVVSNPYARAFAPQVEIVKEEDHEVSMGQNQLKQKAIFLKQLTIIMSMGLQNQ